MSSRYRPTRLVVLPVPAEATRTLTALPRWVPTRDPPRWRRPSRLLLHPAHLVEGAVATGVPGRGCDVTRDEAPHLDGDFGADVVHARERVPFLGVLEHDRLTVDGPHHELDEGRRPGGVAQDDLGRQVLAPPAAQLLHGPVPVRIGGGFREAVDDDLLGCR